jgi:DNA-binding CsgD family transcriptional regulator
MVRGVFVGREHERALLDVRLKAALDGDGQVVLIAGEPGVGKTRLARDLVERTGVRHSWGRCAEGEGSPPFWPFRQVVDGIGGASTLWRPQSYGEDSVEDPAQHRFRLFAAVTELLVAAAEPDGLLLVLDDLQWADPGSVHLLAHLTRELARSRLLVVGTFRDTETTGRPALRAALASLSGEPAVTRLALAGLTEPEVAVQLAEVAGGPVQSGAVAAVFRRTRGNPFFVSELGRLWNGSGVPEELPTGVRDAVRGRLGRLSPACRSVILQAAVLGSELDPAALAATADRPLLDEVLAGIDEATDAGILGDRRFAHDLIRETAVLEVGTAQRLALHQRMADYLATTGDADLRVGQIAFHLLEALPAGDTASAIAWTERAARQATAQLAWEDASAWYGRALEVGHLDPLHRARLLLARGQAQVRAYDVDGARQSVLAAAAVARDIGDGEVLADASLTLEGINDYFWVDTGRKLCEEAIQAVGQQENAVKVRLMAQQVVNDAWQAIAGLEARSAEVLAMAERVGDRRALVEALRARQFARCTPDGAHDRIALGNRLLALGDSESALWGHLWRFDAYAQLGRLDDAEAILPALDSLAERMRSPLPRWHATRSRAAIAFARGRLPEAQRLGSEAVTLARRAGNPGVVFPSLGFLMLLGVQTGDLGPAAADVIDAHANTVDKPLLQMMATLWLLTAGDRDRAHRLYQSLPEPGFPPAFFILSSLSVMAELAAEFDDTTNAARIYTLLSPYADYFVCPGAGAIFVFGSTHHYLGIAAATCNRLDDAIAHLRTAVATNQRAAMPCSVAFSSYELAVVLSRRKRTGDREESAALAAAVVTQADQLGMEPLLTKAKALAASLGGRRAGPLSGRQVEIAGLVAKGLMNQQIAAALHLSERTVETHVRHILTRLGFANRSQIAAWVVEQKMDQQSA